MIKPTNMPAIIRNCSKCKNASRFVCSGNFRINANGKNIDVWLIYKCEACNTTWNMEILSRKKPSEIDKLLYECVLHNDYKTAVFYAFDQKTLSKNKAVVSYEDVSYHISQKEIECDDNEVLVIISPYDMGLRLDKLLSNEWNVSRAKIKSYFEDGSILGAIESISIKTKVKGTIKLRINTN